MQILKTLPEGYSVIKRIHKKQLTTNIAIIAIGAFIMCTMAYIMDTFFVPIKSYFNSIQNTQEHIWAYLSVILFVCIYVIFHELLHGMFMKLYGVKKVFYSYNGILSYAYSNEFIPKRYYTIITIAPFVICGILLLILNLIVSVKYFWLIYSIQIFNFAYSLGDAYLILLLNKTPHDTLISNENSSKCFYSKSFSIEDSYE